VCTLPVDTWETVIEHGLWAALLEAAEVGCIDPATKLLAPRVWSDG